MLDHKEAIKSHFSWASLFLGFHTLGLYVHNDVMLAFGTPEKEIWIEPIFAQWIESAHGKTSYGCPVEDFLIREVWFEFWYGTLYMIIQELVISSFLLTYPEKGKQHTLFFVCGMPGSENRTEPTRAGWESVGIWDFPI
jgi:hypothetical protein